MKYEKDKEDKRVAREMGFYDRFGNEIDRCISFDSDTGIAVVWEPEDGPGGHGPMVKREKYHPEAIAIVDNVAKPDEEQMQNIREKHTGKKELEQ